MLSLEKHDKVAIVVVVVAIKPSKHQFARDAVVPVVVAAFAKHPSGGTKKVTTRTTLVFFFTRSSGGFCNLIRTDSSTAQPVLRERSRLLAASSGNKGGDRLDC